MPMGIFADVGAAHTNANSPNGALGASAVARLHLPPAIQLAAATRICVAFDCSSHTCKKPETCLCKFRTFGASDVTRTRDLLITSEMHYRLCYTSIFS